jgi:hypothetical protein
MKDKRLKLSICFFVLVFLSCSTGEAPYEHRYVINLVLKPDMKFQRAFVDSTYRLDQPVGSELTGIGDAEIFVVDENSDTFRFGESDTLIGLYYSNDSSFVQYGMKYLVNISVEGEIISREVQVPGELTIISPEHLDTISLSDPPLLVWNSCEYCFENAYDVLPYFTGEMAESDSFPPMVSLDTFMGIFSAGLLFKEKDTMYTILVQAKDSNAYEFSNRWFEYGELKEGKAIGLIGALSFDTIAVWVTE